MQAKFDLKRVGGVALAVLFTWLIHEFSHWLTGKLLGYEMVMTFNSAYPACGSYLQDWHYLLISAVGPIITVLQAFIIYIIIRRNHHIYWYPFLFSCFYMRVLAGFMNIINLNDEGRIGAALGIGVYTLPLIISVLLFLLVYHISRLEKYSLKLNVITFALVAFFSSILIVANDFFHLHLLV